MSTVKPYTVPERWKKKWVSIFCETCRRRVAVKFRRLRLGVAWQCGACTSGKFPKWKCPDFKYFNPARVHPYAWTKNYRPLNTTKYVTVKCELCGRNVTRKLTKLRKLKKWKCAKCTTNPSPRTYMPFTWKMQALGQTRTVIPPRSPRPSSPPSLHHWPSAWASRESFTIALPPPPPVPEIINEDDAASKSSDEYITIN